jgi:hypothetical protein
MEDDEQSDASSHSFVSFQVPGGLALTNSEKLEALAEMPEGLFQPVEGGSDPQLLRCLTE